MKWYLFRHDETKWHYGDFDSQGVFQSICGWSCVIAYLKEQEPIPERACHLCLWKIKKQIRDQSLPDPSG